MMFVQISTEEFPPYLCGFNPPQEETFLGVMSTGSISLTQLEIKPKPCVTMIVSYQITNK